MKKQSPVTFNAQVVGDGITDDAPAIQAAIDAAHKAHGNVWIGPPRE